MKRMAGIIAVSLLMMSLTSLADVSYSSLGNDPSKVEPRADGVLVVKEGENKGQIVVNINQYEAEAACANYGGLPDIFTLAKMFVTNLQRKSSENPQKDSSEEKCPDSENSAFLRGSNEYLCYTASPLSRGLDQYVFWSSSNHDYGNDVVVFNGLYGGWIVSLTHNEGKYAYNAALCARPASAELKTGNTSYAAEQECTEDKAVQAVQQILYGTDDKMEFNHFLKIEEFTGMVNIFEDNSETYEVIYSLRGEFAHKAGEITTAVGVNLVDRTTCKAIVAGTISYGNEQVSKSLSSENEPKEK